MYGEGPGVMGEGPPGKRMVSIEPLEAEVASFPGRGKSMSEGLMELRNDQGSQR